MPQRLSFSAEYRREAVAMLEAPLFTIPGFDEKFEDYCNVFNQSRPANPLNPINLIDANKFFLRINRIILGNSVLKVLLNCEVVK